MKNYLQEVGTKGEEIAIEYLQKNGFTILKHHFTMHWGELDIIAQKDRTICFVEVKTRIGTAKGKPYEAVTYFKIRHIKRAAEQFLVQNKLRAYKYSIDVISIILNTDFSVKELLYFTNIS